MGLCIQKEPHKTDNILQKKPTILRSLLIVATPYVCIGLCIHNGTSPQRLHFGSVMLYCKLSTANSTRGDIFECCFKAQSSKLEPLFSLKRGKRDVRALSFELWAFENVTPSGIGCTNDDASIPHSQGSDSVRWVYYIYIICHVCSYDLT